MVIDDIQNSPPDIDRAEIFGVLLRRQALRREAQLPSLDVRAEYHRAVRLALWRQHVERHHDRIRAEILAQQRARHGEGWGLSWGGSMALSLMTQRALRATFRE